MKLKKLIILAVAPMMCLAASAQEFAPKKGDFTVAATISYNSYTNIDYLSGSAQSHTMPKINNNWMEKDLTIGIEGGWFFKDEWKLNIGGGLNFNKTPGEAAVQGTFDNVNDSDNTVGNIPTYNQVPESKNMQFHIFAGIDRYFNINVKNLMPYVGYRLGYTYGNSIAKGDNTWMGKSVAETFNIRNAVTAGVDYFLNEAFFVGAQIDPIAYTYGKSAYKPQEGLGTLKGSNHNFDILAAPTIKVGFKF